MTLSAPDLAALAFFVVAWVAYAILIEGTAHGKGGLNAQMDIHRETWMRQMLARQNRIVDSHITSSLQNGTAFFASASLIALGGAVTLFHSTEDMLAVVAALPFGRAVRHVEWEVKVMGLVIIFVYAFFKFAWSYRLYNYVAIMIGAAPPAAEKDSPEAKDFVRRAAEVITDAGRHFNRGQRALFFALGYLGWFIGPLALIVTTAGTLVVLWRRQFASPSRAAVLGH